MALERVWKGLLVVAVLSVVGVVLVQAGVVSPPWSPDEGKVRIVDGEADSSAADPKAVVDVEVADSARERYTGLSDHDSLADGEGMLFVHGDEGERTYVMREMAFDIDIVFIGADREITAIRHARAPGPGEDGEDLEYSGRAKWVLEVPRGYANETGIAVGDAVEIDLESSGPFRAAIGAGVLERVASTAPPPSSAPAAVGARTYFDS